MRAVWAAHHLGGSHTSCRSTESAMATMRGFGDINHRCIKSSQLAWRPYSAFLSWVSNSMTAGFMLPILLGPEPEEAKKSAALEKIASLAFERLETSKNFARPRAATSGCSTKSSKKKRRTCSGSRASACPQATAVSTLPPASNSKKPSSVTCLVYIVI